jgi:hypothetical protein
MCPLMPGHWYGRISGSARAAGAADNPSARDAFHIHATVQMAFAAPAVCGSVRTGLGLPYTSVFESSPRYMCAVALSYLSVSPLRFQSSFPHLVFLPPSVCVDGSLERHRVGDLGICPWEVLKIECS